MKAELEAHDIEGIAQRVIDLLKPVISGNNNHVSDDCFMTVKQLSQYIGLSTQWIHNNLKDIPHLNLGNKPLFKKSEIDLYLEQFRKKTLSETTPYNLPESAIRTENIKPLLKKGTFRNQKTTPC
ncbi:MAG: helix-turn-helix domain-containing protein [Nitrospirae bacterium]|nr:helix-turn-helix domain-containing protein [Nitrospirota bacterium]